MIKFREGLRPPVPLDEVEDMYWDARPDYRVVEGEHTEGPFNRSAAISAVAKLAGNWDVAVIADADTWVPYVQLDEAVRLARRTGKPVSALSSVVELGQDCMETLLSGRPLRPRQLSAERARTDEITVQSSMTVVARMLWQRIGGFDLAFQGWGGEDNAFWKAATILGGMPVRVDGAAFHLRHPTTDIVTRKMDPLYRQNLERRRRYEQVTCECGLRRVRAS
jgi:N-terminal domain of galactosyltransferase